MDHPHYLQISQLPNTYVLPDTLVVVIRVKPWSKVLIDLDDPLTH